MISPQSFPTGAWSMPSLGCGQCLVQVLRISVTKFQTCQSVTRIPEQMEGILSKHLKKIDAWSIINTSRMLQWNWDASKGNWDCGCASTSFSFLGVGVGFLIAEVQAHWWYKSQIFHQIVNVSRLNSAKSSIGSSMVLLVQYSAEKMSEASRCISTLFM